MIEGSVIFAIASRRWAVFCDCKSSSSCVFNNAAALSASAFSIVSGRRGASFTIIFKISG